MYAERSWRICSGGGAEILQKISNFATSIEQVWQRGSSIARTLLDLEEICQNSEAWGDAIKLLRQCS